MKQFVLASLMAVLSITAFAQTGSVKGRVLDPTGQGAVGANVILKGSLGVGATANLDGEFVVSNVPTGEQTFVISSIGLNEKEVTVTVTDGGTADLGTVELAEAIIGLKEVQVIASVAIDRKTPVAVSSIKGDIIETKLGNQEFPEILRSTPGIYATKQGGGFGDARINVRGFNQRNVAVMINGIPVNDMENGWVYWSNWAGLSDVTSQMQVQRGLGATKLAVSAVGGSINIITNAAEIEQGGSVSVNVGNNGYQKYGLMYSSGLMDNGLAVTVQGTRTTGDGYVQGTQFSAWSYFASLSKQFGDKHTIAFTGLGAPQWHHQRSWANPLSDYAQFQTGPKSDVRTYSGVEGGDQFNIRYNSDFGYMDGEEFANRRNFYHKPKFFLNHYWTLNQDWEVATSAYYSAGRGGGTGDLGNINGGRIFFGTFDDENGHLRFDDIRTWNSGGTVDDFGADNTTWAGGGGFDGQYVGQSRSNGFIRRASMNEHNWFGVISNVTGSLSDNLSLSAGIDLRSYRGLHYRRVENLNGLAAYFDDDDINEPEKFITAEGRADGNQIDYNNDGLVQWYSGYGQLEYSTDKITAFVSGTASLQRFRRIDYFGYEDTDPEQTSPWVPHLGGTAKGGLNYNINDNHNVFINGGYFSQQPIFDNVFVNFSNDVDEEIENRTVNAIEVGYGLRTGFLSLNLNAYRTVWANRTVEVFIRDYATDTDGNGIDGRARFTNLGQQHQGLELDFSINPVRFLTINGMVSLGDWTYTNDFNATVFNADDQGVVLGDETLYIDNVKVGDAAQTTFNLEAIVRPINGMNIYTSFYRADDLYASFDIESPTFFTEGNQAWQLPAYNLVDAGASYNTELGPLDVTFRVNVNNVLNTTYLSEADTNFLPGDDGLIPDGNRVFFGFGRTWNTGIKVRF
ncbi:MAG TPA: TonB-dependent receptor [Cytophagales bacterium]|nr:TonB-dependent receptor [Cytophagales bacterium]HAA20995.1 TonB-dependent receptor [Cytophagales bacterium]HAP61528.1 TonB-dependent receptor [Cytophagales bacterium]